MRLDLNTGEVEAVKAALKFCIEGHPDHPNHPTDPTYRMHVRLDDWDVTDTNLEVDSSDRNAVEAALKFYIEDHPDPLPDASLVLDDLIGPTAMRGWMLDRGMLVLEKRRMGSFPDPHDSDGVMLMGLMTAVGCVIFIGYEVRDPLYGSLWLAFFVVWGIGSALTFVTLLALGVGAPPKNPDHWEAIGHVAHFVFLAGWVMAALLLATRILGAAFG